MVKKKNLIIPKIKIEDNFKNGLLMEEDKKNILSPSQKSEKHNSCSKKEDQVIAFD